MAGLEIFSLKQTIILIIAFSGFFLGGLVAAALLIREIKSLKSWLFLLLLFIFGLFQVHYIFYETQALFQAKPVNLFPIAAIYLLGPVLFHLSKDTLSKDYRFHRKDCLHYLPVLVIIMVSWVVIEMGPPPSTDLLGGYYYNTSLMMIRSPVNLIFLVYFTLSIREFTISYILSKSLVRQSASSKAVLGIILGLSATIILDTIAVVFNEIRFMELSLVCLNLVISSLFLILFCDPDYQVKLQNVIAKEKKRRSYLDAVNLDALTEKIDYLMNTKEIFTNENINLETLASETGVTRHQLSEFLNRVKNENFSSFINRYRVQKAKALLIRYPDQKILAIAFDVGFKSKSTFNAAFIKFEKTTPAQFRKNHIT